MNYWKEKCNSILNQSKDPFLQILRKSVASKKEIGARMCQDKATETISLGIVHTGAERDLVLKKGCHVDARDIGSFHSHHTKAPNLSFDDVMNLLIKDEEVTCIAANPPFETYPPMDKYEGAEILKCYINDQSHPLTKSIRSKLDSGTKITEQELDHILDGWDESKKDPTVRKGYKAVCEQIFSSIEK